MKFTGTVKGKDDQGRYIDRIEVDRDTREAAKYALKTCLTENEKLVSIQPGEHGDYDIGRTDG